MAGLEKTLEKPLVSRSYRLTKTYLKVILDNPESRRIFQFLCLNFSYMFIQLVYGVYTNSLGLISDAIHMAFDNLAIAIGLFASIMATWKPDSDFTYGYGRVETLSGFANGVLLILISLFIIFESIERIINPPEMEVSQLMVVSIGGLLVNLFGMFAMGGHHHHHHGHSHCSHSHDHGHKHVHSSIHVDKGHSHTNDDESKSLKASAIMPHGHTSEELKSQDYGGLFGSAGSSGHDDEHAHNHGHSHTHTDHHEEDPHNHSNNHSHSHAHSHSHPHSHSHSDSHHSHNMRGVFLHILADTMGSVGVVISTLMIQYWGWTGFDPIASLFIAVLIIASVVPLVIDCSKILSLDVGEANEANIKKTLTDLLNIEGLDSYENARFWPQDDSTLMGALHIKIKSQNNTFDHAHRQTRKHSSVEKVVEKVEYKLLNGIPGLKDVAIQVEPSL